MKKYFININYNLNLIFILPLIIFLNACTILNQERTFRFSESEIESKIKTKFPLTKTYLSILHLTLNNPKIYLQDPNTNNYKNVNANTNNRIRINFDSSVQINGIKEIKPLIGQLDVSGEIKYLPEKGQFFLIKPVIENINFQNLPAIYNRPINELANQLLNTFYIENPIYTLDENNFKQALAKRVLKSISIENRELVLKMGE